MLSIELAQLLLLFAALALHGYFWALESFEFVNEVLTAEVVNNWPYANLRTCLFLFAIILIVGFLWPVRVIVGLWNDAKKEFSK